MGHITLRITQIEGRIIIDYEDNGQPLPIPFEKALEPFYTTLKAKGHQGLGMNIIYNTVVAMEGTLNYLPQETGMHYQIEVPYKP